MKCTEVSRSQRFQQLSLNTSKKMHYSLADYITDLVQNSIEAKSSLIIVDLLEENSTVKVYIIDNGTGMDEATLKRVKDPFFTDGSKHEHRKVGLGVSFLSQMVSQCEGTWDISSEKGEGTSVFFSYVKSHTDAPPMGNIVSAIMCCMGIEGEYEMKFRRVVDNKEYTVLRSELVDAVGDFSDTDSLLAIRTYLKSLEQEILEKKGSIHG